MPSKHRGEALPHTSRTRSFERLRTYIAESDWRTSLGFIVAIILLAGSPLLSFLPEPWLEPGEDRVLGRMRTVTVFAGIFAASVDLGLLASMVLKPPKRECDGVLLQAATLCGLAFGVKVWMVIGNDVNLPGWVSVGEDLWHTDPSECEPFNWLDNAVMQKPEDGALLNLIAWFFDKLDDVLYIFCFQLNTFILVALPIVLRNCLRLLCMRLHLYHAVAGIGLLGAVVWTFVYFSEFFKWFLD